ncbi:MAG: SPOR domain-containing protein [Woeseiaceae bacterium]
MKERIIGAVVLVAIAVLVVPVFLDGPPAQGEVLSEVVRMPGQDDSVEIRTQVLDRNREDPMPARQAPQRQTPAAKPVAQAAVQSPPPGREEAVESKPQAQKNATATASSPTGMWAVQLGSFSNQQNAEKLAADLRKQGFAAFLSQVSTSSGALHRVRIGPQKDREAAEAMAQRLSTAGHKGQVVSHP